MEHNFFPQRPAVTPTIYAYRLPGIDSHKGYLKIGYTDRNAKERIEEQLHTSKIKYEIVLVESAMANDGSCFTDKGEFYQFNLSSCIRQQNSLTAQFVSFSLSNLANIFYPPPIFTIINLCLL